MIDKCYVCVNKVMFCCGGMHSRHVVVDYLLNEINTSNVDVFYVAFSNPKQVPVTGCFFQFYIVQSNKFAFSIITISAALYTSLPTSANFTDMRPRTSFTSYRDSCRETLIVKEGLVTRRKTTHVRLLDVLLVL